MVGGVCSTDNSGWLFTDFHCDCAVTYGDRMRINSAQVASERHDDVGMTTGRRQYSALGSTSDSELTLISGKRRRMKREMRHEE